MKSQQIVSNLCKANSRSRCAVLLLTLCVVVLGLLGLLVPSRAYAAETNDRQNDTSASYTDTSGGDTPLFEGEGSEELEHMATLISGTKVRTRVVRVVSDNEIDIGDGTYTMMEHTQTLEVKVLDGTYKGRTLRVIYDLSDAWGGGNEPEAAKVGDMLICQFSTDETGLIKGEVVQFGRHGSLLVLSIIFLVLLTLFGGKRGLRSIAALVVTCVGLIFVMIPAMVNGMNAVLAAILACIFAVGTTLLVMYGFTIKTLAAALGAWGGLIMAGVITAIMNATMNMTGLVDDESMYLAQSVGNGTIDLRGILFAAILIGVLGGTIDVGISIASALDELGGKADNITGVEMMKSGISIGIDIMGASLNTLILSYVGGSIHLLMLFYTYDNPMLMVINDEMIACELLRSLAGSCGLLLTVPITSFVAAAMMCKGNFGKLTPDCFQTVVMYKRAKAKLEKLLDRLDGGDMATENTDKSERIVREEEELSPDNLYEKAQKHREQLENSDADDLSGFFGGED